MPVQVVTNRTTRIRSINSLSWLIQMGILITYNYKDNVMPADRLRYMRRGCKIRLYLLTEDPEIVEDWTGVWENRIKSLRQRKKA